MLRPVVRPEDRAAAMRPHRREIGLVAMADEAMARSPDERYQSVVELAKDLRALLEQP